MIKELIDSYEDYIRVLGEEINEMHWLAHDHGWKSKRGEIGQQCRERIAKAKVDFTLLPPCAPDVHSKYKELYPSWILCPICGIKL